MAEAEAEFMHCQAKWFARCGVSVQSRRVVLPGLGSATVVLEAGRGEPLLLIHGGGGLADDWAPLAAQLQDQFRLLMVYLPGHGLADPVDFRNVDVRGYAVRFLTLLMDELGLKQCGVIGNSIGGYWSLALAAAKPERVSALLLLGAPAGFGQHVPLFFRLMAAPGVGRVMQRLSRFASRQQIRQMFGRFAVARIERVPDAYIDLVSASFRLGDSGSSYHTMLRQLLGTMSDIRNAVANLQAPLLILWGDRDCFGPPDSALQVCQGHGHARVELIPDAGHLPWFDCPAVVAGFARQMNAVVGRGTEDPAVQERKERRQ